MIFEGYKDEKEQRLMVLYSESMDNLDPTILKGRVENLN